jgi:hypothetical protein
MINSVPKILVAISSTFSGPLLFTSPIHPLIEDKFKETFLF